MQQLRDHMATGVVLIHEYRCRPTFERPFDSLRESLRVAIKKMREEGLVRPELFIDKPIDPEELIEAVRGLIG